MSYPSLFLVTTGQMSSNKVNPYVLLLISHVWPNLTNFSEVEEFKRFWDQIVHFLIEIMAFFSFYVQVVICFFGGGRGENWSTNNIYIWENHILEYHLDNYQRTLRRLFMEKIDQCEVTFEITVNHYNGKYKIHVEIPVVVQVLCSLEKEKEEKNKLIMLVAKSTQYIEYQSHIFFFIHISPYIEREKYLNLILCAHVGFTNSRQTSIHRCWWS